MIMSDTQYQQIIMAENNIKILKTKNDKTIKKEQKIVSQKITLSLCQSLSYSFELSKIKYWLRIKRCLRTVKILNFFQFDDEFFKDVIDFDIIGPQTFIVLTLFFLSKQMYFGIFQTFQSFLGAQIHQSSKLEKLKRKAEQMESESYNKNVNKRQEPYYVIAFINQNYDENQQDGIIVKKIIKKIELNYDKFYKMKSRQPYMSQKYTKEGLMFKEEKKMQMMEVEQSQQIDKKMPQFQLNPLNSALISTNVKNILTCSSINFNQTKKRQDDLLKDHLLMKEQENKNGLISSSFSLQITQQKVYPIKPKIPQKLSFQALTSLFQTRGLKNLGNTCYMNAGLQCLHKTAIFTKRMQQINSKDTPEADFVETYQELSRQLSKSNVSAYNSSRFKHLFGQKDWNFQGRDQKDCFEFLSSLFNVLHESLNTVKVKRSVSINPEIKDDDKLCKQYQERDQLRQRSIMDDIFFGRFRTSYTCCKCTNEQAKFERFSVIHLPISAQKRKQNYSLQESIRYFQRPDKLKGDNAWWCEHCKDQTETNRRMRIFKGNQILIFCFKRFADYKKLNTLIDFPFEFDFNEMMGNGKYENEQKRGRSELSKERKNEKRRLKENKQAIYSLYGVVNHYGTLEGGHYTAYCSNGQDQWWEFNDTHVSPIDKNRVATRNAFMLFYNLRTP